MRVFLAVWLVFALSAFASAAVVEGTLYDYAFNPIAGTVQVNSTPAQKVVAVNGTYGFEVGPGTYLLLAVSRENASSSQVLVVEREGTYRLDIVILDELGLNQPDNSSLGLLEAGGLPDLGEGVDGASGFSGWQWAGALIVLAVAGYYYLRKRKTAGPHKTEESPPSSPSANQPELADEREVMAALDASGGLLTQKDLRKALPHWSEARVSLVVTSLEAAGKLKKIKKGRGNVIRKA